MDRQSFKKYGTAHRFSSRKLKSLMAKKSRKKLLVPLSQSERFVELQFSTDDVNALPSTSSVASPVEEVPSTSTNRTDQVHLFPKFVSPETSPKCAAAVRVSMSSVLLTKQKMQLTGAGKNPLVRSHSRNF